MLPSKLLISLSIAAVGSVADAASAQSLQSRDLATPPAHPSNAPLFELIDPEESGLVFSNRYDHPDKWGGLWRQYFNGSIGTGVCLGDVNGDGLPDVFAVGKDSPNGLFLNRGGFRFEDVTENAGVAGGGGMGAGATMVDIDNDGDLDLYVCYVGSTNELYLNDGSGLFNQAAAEWGLDFNTGSNAPSFGDYDRDGDLDLYLQKNFLAASGVPAGLPDQLYRHDGDTFVEVTEEAGIEGEGQGHVAIWWDYNEDGWPDLYVANDFEAPDKLYRNNQDGTFTDVIGETLVAAPYSSMGADVGDINNDGHIDLIAAEMKPRSRAYYHRTVGPLAGKLLNIRESGVNQYMQNMLSVRVGPSEFAEIAAYAGLDATDWTWSPRLLDLDNDGLLDAYFTNGMARAFHDADIAIRVSKARSLMQKVALFERSPPLLEENLAFRNTGDMRFSESTEQWGLGQVGVSFAAAAGDLDLDGDVDLVVGNWDGPLLLYRNQSDKGQRVMIALEGRQSNRFGVGARVTAEADGVVQTRELSLMRGYMAVDAPELRFAFADADRLDRLVVRWPSGAKQILEDLPLGKRYTVVEAEEEKGDAALVESEGGTLFVRSDIAVDEASRTEEEYFQIFKGQALLPFVEDRLGPPLVVADLDGDGWQDVALGGPTGQALRVLRNVQGERLVPVQSEAFEDDFDSEDAGIVAHDFDGDGDSDLFVSSGGVELDDGDRFYADRMYRNVGDMRFERWEVDALDELRQSSGAVAWVAGRDGAPDQIIVAGGSVRRDYPQAAANRIWRLQDGTIAAAGDPMAEAFSTSEKSADFAVADLDGDGDDDLVQTVNWAAPNLWRNEGGAWEPMPLGLEESRLKGFWRSTAAADFDGDGRVDVALGNLGLNTKYKPTPETPAVLLSLHEAGEAARHIEAVEEGGELFLTEPRLFHQMYFPEIMGATGSYEAFADMSVAEIFPADLISQVERRELTEPRSGLLIAQPEGGFSWNPLPDLAQTGVAIDVLATDIDADGDQDLVVVNQSLSPLPVAAIHPERSFLTILRNDGSGNFQAVLPWQSGLSVPSGEPRSLAWSDLDHDGNEELLVATNGGPLYVFQRAAD